MDSTILLSIRPSVGSSGIVRSSRSGVPAAMAEKGPTPLLFPAFTASSYSVPLVRPVMVVLVALKSPPNWVNSVSPATR